MHQPLLSVNVLAAKVFGCSRTFRIHEKDLSA